MVEPSSHAHRVAVNFGWSLEYTVGRLYVNSIINILNEVDGSPNVNFIIPN